MSGQQRRPLRAPVYDVIIVGSGAAGGTAAWILVQAGLRVAMLETGPIRKDPMYFPNDEPDFPYHSPFPYEDQYRGLKYPIDKADEFKARFSIQGSSQDEPYTTPEKMPYDWFRARNVGGRTMFWGRFANRFNEDDFRGYSRDGHGKDWPIAYKEIAPYYDEVEKFMGVCGAKENHPDLPDSENFLPPVAYKCSDIAIKKAAEKAGLRTIHVRRAMLTKAYNGYAQCHFCSGCEEGCETHSFYTSAFRQVLPLVRKYPRTFTLIPNAMAHKIKTDAKGRAGSVSYIDKTNGSEQEIRARRAVIVACGTLESTRLMLNSGIANSSGMIGKNFMEHLDVGVVAYFPELFFAERERGDGIGGSHIVIPWFGYFRPNEKRDFLRGFQIEPSSRMRMREKNPKNIPGFGSEFKREVRKWMGARVRLASHGEMLPSPNKFVELDANVKDKWGIPVLNIHHPWEENDHQMTKYIIRTYEEILSNAKAIEIRMEGTPFAPGHSIHEMGTMHMGSDRKTSVLNKFNQSWDVRNLFVLDAAAFTSGTHKNPTLTIMALSWRASKYILDQMKKGIL
ncbi:MAG: GMC family oxidoreductase [Acidobacteria bacterium]|nr:GMC family oxidoreductase [Acidobacteriota bacterium]